jgi:hypothetical protein
MHAFIIHTNSDLCTKDEKTCDRSEKIHLHVYNDKIRYRAYYKGKIYKMQNQRMPKQTAPTTVEGTRTRVRPGKRWKNETDEDLNIMEMNKKANVRVTEH